MNVLCSPPIFVLYSRSHDPVLSTMSPSYSTPLTRIVKRFLLAEDIIPLQGCPLTKQINPLSTSSGKMLNDVDYYHHRNHCGDDHVGRSTVLVILLLFLDGDQGMVLPGEFAGSGDSCSIEDGTLVRVAD